MSARATVLAVAAALALATWATYRPLTDFPFLAYQDDRLLLANPVIRAGLSTDGIAAAFTSVWEAQWAPLSWLSHMLDFSLFGTDAGAHHRTSLLLHVANVLLLFGALRTATGSTWRSSFVAGLFALHPIHVEPVAWISERKGILAGTFGLASLWCYAGYGRSGDRRLLNLSSLLLAGGLLSKFVLVTLPLLFLLLDVWPLGRGGIPLRARIREKAPHLVLAGLALLIGLGAQAAAGAIQSTAALPLADRIANALVSYVRYLGKLAWPVHLAVLYPHPNLPGGSPWTFWQAAAAAAALAAVTLAALRARQPALRVGWLWFLIALVPTIGLVQVGSQAMADRYLYLPAVGIYLALTWGIGESLAGAGRSRRRAVLAAAAVALALSAGLSRLQLQHWRSSETLFRHAAAVTRSFSMHFNLGNILKRRGRIEEAIAEYQRAIAIHPDMGRAHFNLANTLLAEERPREAIAHYRRAAETLPSAQAARRALGDALMHAGDLEAAIAHYREEVRRRPRSLEARGRLGHLLRMAGDLSGAIEQYRVARELSPGNPAWAREIEAVRAQQREASTSEGDARQASRGSDEAGRETP